MLSNIGSTVPAARALAVGVGLHTDMQPGGYTLLRSGRRAEFAQLDIGAQEEKAQFLRQTTQVGEEIIKKQNK